MSSGKVVELTLDTGFPLALIPSGLKFQVLVCKFSVSLYDVE